MDCWIKKNKPLRFGVKLKFDTWCQRIPAHIYIWRTRMARDRACETTVWLTLTHAFAHQVKYTILNWVNGEISSWLCKTISNKFLILQYFKKVFNFVKLSNWSLCLTNYYQLSPYILLLTINLVLKFIYLFSI
jgi:hypothetical protein